MNFKELVLARYKENLELAQEDGVLEDWSETQIENAAMEWTVNDLESEAYGFMNQVKWEKIEATNKEHYEN